ncbi:hypothetical protein FBY40_0343 [Microbacterium sp. SLBN-154]|uniref:GNAT family N-acetyltransferase n=1 Tax=Microbacterium sp. SLBN-154 TaxID=2768458 RepID=UPI00115497A9|nr:GNAT family N-acetyltransferase [Microbacterium sp. SLBN-154]TQK17861.1 hypothetical protein FBY40_0343 [Microbacterium sp. SLBN-154]
MGNETDTDSISVTRNDEAGRYEIHVGDALGGFSQYITDSRGRELFIHTEIDEAFAGRGLGGTLVGQAMADVAARGVTVVPRCPFVARWLGKHEVSDLQVDWPEPRP